MDPFDEDSKDICLKVNLFILLIYLIVFVLNPNHKKNTFFKYWINWNNLNI